MSLTLLKLMTVCQDIREANSLTFFSAFKRRDIDAVSQILLLTHRHVIVSNSMEKS